MSRNSAFRAVNRHSEPDFGRTVPGKASESALRPAFGWPEDRFRTEYNATSGMAGTRGHASFRFGMP